MSYDPQNLPDHVAIHAGENSERIVTTIRPEAFSEEVREVLATEGIWGAYRLGDGRVFVKCKDGSIFETDLMCSEYGDVL